MIFFRYQNTKTFETNSKYVDMRMLYNEVIYRRDFTYPNQDVTTEFMCNLLYEEFSEELKYRKGLEPSQYRDIIRTVCDIALNSEKKDSSPEEKIRDKEVAFDKIDKLLEDYPLDGIFVIPEYGEGFEFGTKYSISELRSKVICDLISSDVKYLAIYSGEVLKKEMTCGGTLLRPTKILGVLPLYKGAIKHSSYLESTEIFYRDIEDEEELSKAINTKKGLLQEFLKYYPDTDISNNLAFSHMRELIIRKALNISRCNYKNLEYRFKDNRHLIEVTGKNIVYKFCIFNEEVTANDLLSRNSINHKGFYIEEDLFNNKKIKQSLNLDLAV